LIELTANPPVPSTKACRSCARQGTDSSDPTIARLRILMMALSAAAPHQARGIGPISSKRDTTVIDVHRQ
jgi:hypothetical protein